MKDRNQIRKMIKQLNEEDFAGARESLKLIIETKVHDRISEQINEDDK